MSVSEPSSESSLVRKVELKAIWRIQSGFFNYRPWTRCLVLNVNALFSPKKTPILLKFRSLLPLGDLSFRRVQPFPNVTSFRMMRWFVESEYKTIRVQKFRQLFEEGLELQKARLREQRAYAKEQQLQNQRRHQDQITSMENYYKDQVRDSHTSTYPLRIKMSQTRSHFTPPHPSFFSLSFHYLLKNLHRNDRRSRFGKKLKKRWNIWITRVFLLNLSLGSIFPNRVHVLKNIREDSRELSWAICTI